MLSPPLSAGPAAPADGTRDGEDPALADQAMAVLVEVAGLAPWRREGEAEVRAHARRLRRLFLRASSAGREGPGLRGALLSPDGTLLLVANCGGNSVSILATASNSTAVTIPVGGSPSTLAARPDGRYVYGPG
ncbi:YncE family protein [Streptomyces hydrogenans]|uniref:YncE family protein n=1 Tax=Streptomyces hydrogenans TaxID=1873719 RepID=UPI0035D5A157